MKQISFFLLSSLLILQLRGQATLRNEGTYGMHLNNVWLVADSTHLLLRASMQNSFAQIKMTGDADIMIETHGNSFGTFEIAKTPFTKVIMVEPADVIQLEDELKFSNIDNHLLLNTASVHLLSSAQVTGYNDRNYCITNTIGYLKKYDLGAVPFEFPVGYDENTYNPVILAETQSPDNYRVRCLEHVLDQGGTGSPLSNGVVDTSWEILEDSPGEMQLVLDAFWAGLDELTGFTRGQCGVARWAGMQWDLTLPNVAPAGGADPYTRERAPIIEDGFFAVGGESIADPGGRVDVKVLLQGPYAGMGEQNDDLRTGGHLPINEPYTTLGFTQAGFGGGEEVVSTVFNGSGNDAIVDWLLLAVYDESTPTQLITTKAALLQKDGDVVDLDGESTVSVPGLPAGNYILGIYHRNHLAVKMTSPVFLSTATTVIDLMTDPNALVGGSNAVADLGDGFYGLISGDFDHNGQVQNTDATGVTQLLGDSGYQSGDIDLNGQIQNIDLQLKLTPNLGRGQQF